MRVEPELRLLEERAAGVADVPRTYWGSLRRVATQRSLPPCGGGTGRGVAAGAESVAPPLPTPPPVEVGFSRLRPLNTGANPGKPRFAWGREQAVPAATVVPPRTAIKYVIVIILLFLAVAPAHADDIADFYQGKTVPLTARPSADRD